jgi:type II secretory ATPase GspE/PulE/Tfp pilus assembly ATPase PilB-like protein
MNQSLVEVLKTHNIISDEQLQLALQEGKKTGEFLGQIIIKLGFAQEDKVLPLLAKVINVPYIKLDTIQIDPEAIKKVSAKFASHFKPMPISLKDGYITLAMSNPTDIHTLDDVRLLLGCEIKPVLSSEIDILNAIKKYYGIGAETIEKIHKKGMKIIPQDKTTEDISLTQDASIIKFVNEIILEAINEQATDIHFEPYEEDFRIRYRIDGILYEIPTPAKITHFQSAIASRIKVMAELNVAEHRLPQDGKIKIKVGEDEYDLRVSVLPTPFGESVSIRILSRRPYTLEELGLFDEDLKKINELIRKPHGIILVTGPTGSGKTTTLYACLTKINSPAKNIITIEDPIEYQIKGITQMQVLPKIEFTFANALRSMLRHDPDVMMVGEIRDLETAELAIRTALTGHLVFSTLHTNDAAGAITRLLDMKIEPYLVSSSIEAIIAQRLVRKICQKCKNSGCQECRYTGYKGRTGIYEILVMNDEIKDLVLNCTPTHKIKEKAIELGMTTLVDDGLRKVEKGITTKLEVMRVTQE